MRADIRDEIIRSQQSMIADLLDRLQEMIGQIHMHQVAAATDPSRQLFVSEAETDIRDMAEEAELSTEELAALLAEAQFLNTNVEFDTP